jgi:deoxycytidylate deaminase
MSSTEQQYSIAINRLFQYFKCSCKCHDVRRAMHFAILVCGRKPVNNPVTNARNVKASQTWIRTLQGNADKSIHAEARAIQHMFGKNHSLGRANGVVVCRFGRDGGLKMSLPCLDCVCILARSGIQYAVYSTSDGNWVKKSIAQLLTCDDVTVSKTVRKKNDSKK